MKNKLTTDKHIVAMRITMIILVFSPLLAMSQTYDKNDWKLISTHNGKLEIPNPGGKQTSCMVLDVDQDCLKEIFISERSQAPSVVMYKSKGKIWQKYLVDSIALNIEAGGASYDIDSDGDMDIAFGGDGRSDQIWWWENPYPDFDPGTPWRRHLIKNDGDRKHHDMIFGDFDNDGTSELAFWNQKGRKLCLAEIPDDPLSGALWEYRAIYVYSNDGQMEQIGQDNYPPFKSINEHEGIDSADIDGDGILDIVGGGLWFKFSGNGTYQQNLIDPSYTFTRTATGQLIEGGRPEVILVVGDGIAPMMLYEWRNGTWYGKSIIDEVEYGHSLSIIDFNGDGFLDIFNAEMRLNGQNPDAEIRILLGDGKGNFEKKIVAAGFGNHESKVADLDGDGDFDIVGKPYNWETPRLDIWINKAK